MDDIVTAETIDASTLTCGIIMPISAIGECSEDHRLDVRHILSTAIEDAGFNPQMVSEAEDIGVIQKGIIQNIYTNPIILCDVSEKNSNVMFELGMRLAFDKPAVIVKDDKTHYSFDTGQIEHLEYPRDLRFPKIVEFQERLVEKIQGTHKSATDDPNYTTFLKHFGTFTVPKLETKEVSKEDYILEEIRALKSLVGQAPKKAPRQRELRPQEMRTLCLQTCSEEQLNRILVGVSAINPSAATEFKRMASNHFHFGIGDFSEVDKLKALIAAKSILPKARLLTRLP